MKKFYFLTLALICAITANAQDVLYMVGYNGAWDPANPTEIPYDNEKGCYYLANVKFTNYELKISEQKGTWDKFNEKAICIAEDKTVEIGVATTMYKYASSNIKIAATGTYDVAIDLNAPTITLKGVVTYPEKIYILGNVEGNNWSTSVGPEMSHQGEGVYAISDVTINGADGGQYGYFSFAEKLGANWNAVNDGTRWGPNAENKLVVLGTADTGLTNNWAGGTQSWKIESGLYNMTLDTKALTLLVTGTPTAIEEVGVDAGEAVYYNLQGVKVANPENGIFIKKQGNKTTKVVL